MTDRWRNLLGEAIRFFAVAQAATWVSFLLFNVLVHGWIIGDPVLGEPISAYVLANTVGMVISYHGARGWVFPDRPPQQADGGWTAYVVINLAAMVLPVGCLIISRHVLGLEDALSDNLSANGIGLVMAFGARFYLFRRFVFRRPSEGEELPDALDLGVDAGLLAPGECPAAPDGELPVIDASPALEEAVDEER